MKNLDDETSVHIQTLSRRDIAAMTLALECLRLGGGRHDVSEANSAVECAVIALMLGDDLSEEIARAAEEARRLARFSSAPHRQLPLLRARVALALRALMRAGIKNRRIRPLWEQAPALTLECDKLYTDPAQQLWVEDKYKHWCGINGLVKPDEIRLVEYLLDDQNPRSELILTSICQRWPAVLKKWVRKGWWEYGVSPRCGWFTVKGREELTRNVNITKEREKKMNAECEFELHSPELNAVIMTHNLIKLLGGKLVERHGRWFIQGDTRPASFIQWALKAAVEPDTWPTPTRNNFRHSE